MIFSDSVQRSWFRLRISFIDGAFILTPPGLESLASSGSFEGSFKKSNLDFFLDCFWEADDDTLFTRTRARGGAGVACGLLAGALRTLPTLPGVAAAD